MKRSPQPNQTPRRGVPLRVLMAASEVQPYSKTGGLADVVGALPKALAALGHKLAVVAPLYRSTRLERPQVTFPSLTIPMGSSTYYPRVLSIEESGVKYYFVDYAPFFDRDGYYGMAGVDYADNAQRFMLLSRVAVEIAKLDFHPDVIHCHDWQSAMVPVLLKTAYAPDPALYGLPTVFTIHNLGYHGAFDPAVLPDVGLPPNLFSIDGLEFFGRVSYLKGGVVFADQLTTVSEGYAREIQTSAYGHGLDGLLRLRSRDLRGVLNGVDYAHWDPAADPHIAARYTPQDLGGKRKCKRDLLKTFGLPAGSPHRPVIGMISRLAVQKGFDLIADAAEQMMDLDMTLAILGSGEPVFEKLLRDLAERFPDKVGLRIAYDETLAHKIEAGADMFLMPSRYEPSGLNQMYSLKYGTVPVVRATGGLEDSVEAFNPSTGEGTGFKFREYTVEAMLEALRQALAVYQDSSVWKKLMRRGMTLDYSWKTSAGKYVDLYHELASKRPEALPPLS